MNLISHIENHANNTPNNIAIYRRVVPIQNKNNYYILILCIILFAIILDYSILFGIFLFFLGLTQIKSILDNDDWEWESVSYRKLNNDINQISKKLIIGGVKPRQKIWLLWAPEQKYELIIMILALLKIGVVISWSSPEQIGGILKFYEKIEEISPELIIGKPFILNIVKFIKFISLGKIFKSITVFYPHYKIISSNLDSECIVETFPAKMDDVAIIGFTTGSTGYPKGVEITFGMLNSQVNSWKKILKDDIVKNNGMVTILHHAINFIFLDLAAGISSVIPEGNILDQDSIDINVVMNIVRRFTVDILTGSPILIKKISDNNYKIPSHVNKIIRYGCELHLNFFDKIKDSFQPGTEGRLLSMYGSTEGGPIAIFDGKDITPNIIQNYKDGNGICLGRTDISIIEVYIRNDDFLYNNTSGMKRIEGEICITGPGASIKCTRDEDTNLTKITDFSGKIYHRTGDYGYYDIYGNLWCLGRISHLVETKWGVFYPLQVEAAVNTLIMPEVFATAFIGIPSSDGSNFYSPFLVFRLFPNHTSLSSETLSNVKILLKSGKMIKHLDIEFIIHDPNEKWPVDPRHKSKIGRPAIARWVASKISKF